MDEIRARVDIRILAACAAFASKEETRYCLNGVCVEIGERYVTYAATDGQRLIVYRDGLFDSDNENTLTGTFIIPTKQAKAFKPGKDAITTGVLTWDEKQLTLTYDGVGITFTPIDGTFPDWRRIVPSKEASGQGGQFNLTLAQSFAKYAKDLDIPSPFIGHDGLESPAIVTFGGHDHTLGVIMPIRVDGELTKTAPAWAVAHDTMAQAAE